MTTTTESPAGSSRPRPARSGQAPRRPGRARAWATRAPLLPALVFLILVTQLPFAATLVISLFEWNALYPEDRAFTGLDNYESVLGESSLRGAVFTTALLTATVVIVSLLLGLALALLLDRRFRGRGLVRTMAITPFLVVPVAAALMWKHLLFNPEYGLLNGLLGKFGDLFGFTAPQPDWISDMPLLAVEISLIWQWTPFMMLILLAGLQSRPAELAEAARIDGAGDWQIFRHLTLPHLRRYLELGALLGSIYVVQNFEAVYTLTGGALDTANLPFVIYREFYRAQDYGVASAAGVLVVIGSLAIAVLALRVVSSLFREEGSRG
ncbi:carbohydrate ABC transporter permease [Streptomyces triticirhizae]|uniref:Sugar ABC transporter permease n=1 Tax=Streptomyces triticirhizae TaxID=2483353 RepID=A0A3M2KV72_9ACTN|nr:sugar ABC transporter permease [Streptomyces triticirhizae]RMI28894.1 sugar ABC transporter permease [Streptomyces triticirhizae]